MVPSFPKSMLSAVGEVIASIVKETSDTSAYRGIFKLKNCEAAFEKERVFIIVSFGLIFSESSRKSVPFIGAFIAIFVLSKLILRGDFVASDTVKPVSSGFGIQKKLSAKINIAMINSILFSLISSSFCFLLSVIYKKQKEDEMKEKRILFIIASSFC